MIVFARFPLDFHIDIARTRRIQRIPCIFPCVLKSVAELALKEQIICIDMDSITKLIVRQAIDTSFARDKRLAVASLHLGEYPRCGVNFEMSRKVPNGILQAIPT